MIHNAGSFLSTPWETIIKVYRKNLKDKSFPTLKDYQEDFITFLHKKNFYSDEATQKTFLYFLFNAVVKSLTEKALMNQTAILADPTPENKAAAIALIDNEFEIFLRQIRSNSEICSEFVDLTLVDFNSFTHNEFSFIIKEFFTNNGLVATPGLIVKIQETLYLYTRIKEEWVNHSGLVFVGFGEDEIYPSLIPVKISLALGTRLRYFIKTNEEIHISNEKQSAISPFGQIDVIHTILTGVDNSLETTFIENLGVTLEKYNQAIIGLVNGSPELMAQINAVDIPTLVEEYKTKIYEAKQVSYINPLYNALDSLSKEDLAEMAESLIYLTYLKRRITFAEESVGGPVDVAIISKGDGFIWTKRKLYFKPELNQYFFDNYLK